MGCKCSYSGCTGEGAYPAPRNPRDIGERQYFCAEHIAEFNKNWNGLQGFSETEIFSLQHGAATWNRPTWRMGVQESMQGTNAQFKTAEELYAFFHQRRETQEKEQNGKPPNHPDKLPADVQEACCVFGVPHPNIAAAQLKHLYLRLVKKHHPDVNTGSPDAEEMVKKINVSYKILTDFSFQNQVAA